MVYCMYVVYTQANMHEFQTIYKKLQAQNIDVILVTPEAERAASIFGNINIVTSDATVIKTAARVIPTYFLMQHLLRFLLC